MTQYDVVIVGAGPAGVAMAASLLSHGITRVLVLERYRFPRAKPCGGGLTGHADQAMEALGLTLNVAHTASTSACVRFGDFKRDVTLESPVNVVQREAFDADLVRQIRERDVDVCEGEGVIGYHRRNDSVQVKTTTGREISASVVVGADGAASVIRKQLLRGEKRLPHRLFRLELALPGHGIGNQMVYDFTPMAWGLRGYLWVFPISSDMVNVGLMHYPAYRTGGRQLVDILRRGLQRLDIELPARGTRGWPVWGYQPNTAIAAPRVVTIGDAAGIDALTGEGIAVAMEQAIEAGRAIAGARASGDYGFQTYRRDMARATVGRELRLDRWLARMLYGSRMWRRFLSLVLYDEEVLRLYAARVSGSQVLADQKWKLYQALSRHILSGRSRDRRLTAAWPTCNSSTDRNQ